MARDELESIIAFLRSGEAGKMSHSDVERLVRERGHRTRSPSGRLFWGRSLRRSAAFELIIIRNSTYSQCSIVRKAARSD